MAVQVERREEQTVASDGGGRIDGAKLDECMIRWEHHYMRRLSLPDLAELAGVPLDFLYRLRRNEFTMLPADRLERLAHTLECTLDGMLWRQPGESGEPAREVKAYKEGHIDGSKIDEAVIAWQVRRKQLLSFSDLSEESGVPSDFIYRLRRNEFTMLSGERLERLANTLGCTLDEMLWKEGPRPAQEG